MEGGGGISLSEFRFLQLVAWLGATEAVKAITGNYISQYYLSTYVHNFGRVNNVTVVNPAGKDALFIANNSLTWGNGTSYDIFSSNGITITPTKYQNQSVGYCFYLKRGQTVTLTQNNTGFDSYGWFVAAK